MKKKSSWYSHRLEQEVELVRWGAVGVPVLLFPTAGGDAEEIERFHVIDCLSELLAAGTIKVYSCDSVAGRVLLGKEGSPEQQMAMQNRFHGFIHKEVAPAIRMDCGSDDIGVIAAGSSIGAFNALAVVCRYPEVFVSALCLSGTFDLERFHSIAPNHEFFFSSPLHFVPHLNGSHLERLQRRFVLFACGEGRAEDSGESWRMASVLGDAEIPNRVDSWGKDWHHDWVTWRKMFPQYLAELAGRAVEESDAAGLDDTGSSTGKIAD